MIEIKKKEIKIYLKKKEIITKYFQPNLLSIKNLSPNPSKEIVKREIKNKKRFFQ